MKVLLTGSTGFVGCHVAKALEAHDIEFVTIGRNHGGNQHNHIVSDLLTTCDFSEIMQEVKPTHLIHLAWYAEHGKYWESPLNLEWMSATYHLLEAFCKHGGQHAVIAGTCAEYDWRYGFCDEDLTPTNPNTFYGIAKDSTRRLSQAICLRNGVSLSWARIFFPYGPGEAQARLIPSLFGVFRKDKVPFGVNDKSFRDFLHISDLAEAFVICASNQVRGIVNISSGEPIALRKVVEIIAKFHNQDPSLILGLESTRKGEPILIVGNNEKLINLGWKQKINIYEGLLNYKWK